MKAGLVWNEGTCGHYNHLYLKHLFKATYILRLPRFGANLNPNTAILPLSAILFKP
jgi:hypothetical protein